MLILQKDSQMNLLLEMNLLLPTSLCGITDPVPGMLLQHRGRGIGRGVGGLVGRHQ